MASKFRTMEELKKDMAQLDLLLETDVQVHQSSWISFMIVSCYCETFVLQSNEVSCMCR